MKRLALTQDSPFLIAIAAAFLGFVASVAILLAATISNDEIEQAPTQYLRTVSGDRGLEEPVLVERYTPLHEMDVDHRTCYAVSPDLEDGLTLCLTGLEERPTVLSWDGSCSSDPDIAEGLVWCSTDVIAANLDFRFGDPATILPGMEETARSNGLEGPEPVSPRGPQERCLRLGPEDDAGVWCWYERIKPELFQIFGHCSLGYGGSFWCRLTEDLPPVDETWDWSWTDGRRVLGATLSLNSPIEVEG